MAATVSPITAEEIKELYEPLFTIGALGSASDGFLRAGWSAEEQAAFDHVRRVAERAGYVARYDAIGNLSLEEPGRQEYVETGSHLDTVVRGGNYDGAAGVISGLAALLRLAATAQTRSRGLRLRIWRGEESASYRVGCKGSRAAFGLLEPEALGYRFEGKTLAEAITERGFSPEPIRSGLRTIAQEELDSIRAHVELHIEQAASLETEGIEIGVVTSIRGPSRWLVTLEGRFDHSGGTPMGKEHRRDANLALAYTLVALDELSTKALASGEDLVQTVGVINSDPAYTAEDPRVQQNATAKVSGFAYFTLDIRSNSKRFRDSYVAEAKECITRVAGEWGARAELKRISESDPYERFDPAILAAVTESARAANYSAKKLPSGGIHDCLYLGQQRRSDGSSVPIGMIFIPCKAGISHSPEEYSSFEQVAQGATVLANSLAELAR